jgi:hypothetical protein
MHRSRPHCFVRPPSTNDDHHCSECAVHIPSCLILTLSFPYGYYGRWPLLLRHILTYLLEPKVRRCQYLKLFLLIDTTSLCVHASVIGIAELCLSIVSYVFDPNDALSAKDMYALRLASHSFSRGILDTVVLRSISVRWNPPIPLGYRVGSTCPKDSRPLFDAKEFVAGRFLSDMTEKRLVKEMHVSTGETYDHDGAYPFGGNCHLLAEVVARLRHGFVHPEDRPLRLVIRSTSYWDWAMISGLTQALDGVEAIHIELRAPYYFPILQNLDGIHEPSFHFHPIVNDTNPHRVNSPLDALPRFLCDTLVFNQPRHDLELRTLLHSIPDRLHTLVVKLEAGADMVTQLALPMPLPFVIVALATLNTLTWEVDVDGSRTDERRVRRLYKTTHMLAGRIKLLIDILSSLPPDNNLRFLNIDFLIGAPFNDCTACVQLHLTVKTALHLLAESLATDKLERVLLSVHIALRPSRRLDKEDRSTDFTFDGLRLPAYKFRSEKERVAAAFDGLQAFLAAAMRPVGRVFIWSVVSSEKSNTCTAKRERYWESKDDLLPWDIEHLFPSQGTKPASALPPRYVVVRAFTGRRFPVRVD